MISTASANSNVFTNPTLMKERFQKAASASAEKTKVIDKLEVMGSAFLMLDQTEHDLDDTPGKVFVGNEKGMMAEVQAHPFGGVLSMEVLDERGADPVEHIIAPDLFGTTYTTSIGGVQTSVYDSGNGMLALMEQMQGLLPDGDEAAEKAK